MKLHEIKESYDELFDFDSNGKPINIPAEDLAKLQNLYFKLNKILQTSEENAEIIPSINLVLHRKIGKSETLKSVESLLAQFGFELNDSRIKTDSRNLDSFKKQNDPQFLKTMITTLENYLKLVNDEKFKIRTR